jgi:hypothetical protein
MEDAPRDETREAAPERHYDLPPPQPAPVEADFASSNEQAWSPPEPSYRDEPRPTQARAGMPEVEQRREQLPEPAQPVVAEESSSDSIPESSNERQAS